MGSVKPEIIIPDVLLIANKLINAALTSANESTLLSSSRLLASFVNKSEQTLALDLLIRIVENIFKQLEKTSDVALKFNCGILFTWVIKGVILRGEPDVEESVSKWFDLLGREDVGQVVAENFGIVLIEDELYLNWESHCNIR